MTIRSGPSRRGTTQWSRQHVGDPRYIEVPADSKVLVVEDALPRRVQFRNWLGSSAKIVSKVSRAIEELRRDKFELVFLDRDLGFGEFGDEIAKVMAENVSRERSSSILRIRSALR